MTEYVIVVSNNERWLERDVYVNGKYVRTERKWRKIHYGKPGR